MTTMTTPDARIKIATLQYFAPNFRCATTGSGTVVEIPDGWERRYTWDRDPKTKEAIDSLIAAHGKRAIVFEGPRRNPPAPQNGYAVPVEEWDRVMAKPVGYHWDKAEISDDEAMELLRAM